MTIMVRTENVLSATVQRFAFLPLIAGLLMLAGCRDYGKFAVAERQWVDDDELPALSEMDLTGINLEFSVGSEAHARVLPEADWPDPVGALMGRVEVENGGALPSNFDLPLEDGCMYVGLEPRYSRFRRVEFRGRTLLFSTYRLGSRISGVPEKDQPEVEWRLAIIDESRDMARHDLRIDAARFELIHADSVLGVASNTGKSIYYRRLDISGDELIASDPVLLASSDHRIDKMTITTESDGAFHLAWLTERYGNLRERLVYYSYFNPDGGSIQPEVLLSDTSTNRFLHLTVNDNQPFVSWVDARFISRGFDTTNQSKRMVGSRRASGIELWPPIVVNIPKDDSENAFSPVFATRHNNAIAFLWGKTSSDSLDKADKQLGMFDVNSKSLTLVKREITHQDIISTALQQQIEHQRSMPIAGIPVPDATECDQWREQLNLKPTGFGVITPEGEKPSTRLILEKKDDDSDDNSNSNRRD